jgi:Skp family chaperone for outer membrane proteins
MRKMGILLAAMFILSIGLSPAYGNQKDSKTNVPSPGLKNESLQMAQAKDSSMKAEYEKYQKKTQGELNDYKKKMKELEAKAKGLKDEAKAEAKRGMDAVHKDIKVAEQKLKSMKSASADAWEKVKSDVDSAIASVKEGYEKVVAQFKG